MRFTHLFNSRVEPFFLFFLSTQNQQGRAGDASVTDKSFKVGKNQTEWDAMDPQQRALIVLNIERTARGLLPVSAVVAPLKTVAEDYAAYLKDKASPAGRAWAGPVTHVLALT